MAVTIGINSGFVSSSPSVNPNGSNGTMDNNAHDTKDTSSAGVNVVTEVGWIMKILICILVFLLIGGLQFNTIHEEYEFKITGCWTK